MQPIKLSTSGRCSPYLWYFQCKCELQQAICAIPARQRQTDRRSQTWNQLPNGPRDWFRAGFDSTSHEQRKWCTSKLSRMMILLNGFMQWREMACLEIYEHSGDERMRSKTIVLRTNEWWMPFTNALIVLVSCPHALGEISAERNEFRGRKKVNPTRNGLRKWNSFAGIGQRQRGAQETRHRK